MPNKLALSAVVLGVSLLAACNSDKLNDGGSGGPIGKETLSQKLMGKNWKLTSMTANPGMQDPSDNTKFITDIFSLMDECDKDDLTRFNNGGIMLLDHGPLKCNPDEAQVDSSGVWQLSDDQVFLITTSPTDGIDSMKIVGITASTATLSKTNIEDGVSQVITVVVAVVP